MSEEGSPNDAAPTERNVSYYNDDMTAEWEQIFSSNNFFDKIVDELLSQYAPLVLAEAKKDEGNQRPLLPVGRKQAEEWLKRRFKLSGISKAARNNDVTPNKQSSVKQLSTMRLQPEHATDLEEPSVDPADRLPATAFRKCTICGSALGRGPGMHLKDECPQEPPERKAERQRNKAHRLAFSNDIHQVVNSGSLLAPVVNVKRLRVVSKIATILEDRIVEPSERLMQVVTHQCKICFARLGRGPGMHLKDECPKEPPERKAEREHKKALRIQECSEYKKGLAERRKKAAAELQKQNRTQNHIKDKVMENCTKCMVCFFSIRKGTPVTSLNWHYFKNRQCLFCPLADHPGKKYEIMSEWKATTKKHNETYRSKRANAAVL